MDIASQLADGRVLTGAIGWNRQPLEVEVHTSHLAMLDRRLQRPLPARRRGHPGRDLSLDHRRPLPALRAASPLPADTRRGGGFDDLAADCAARLRARLAQPPRPDDDWSIDPPGGCACELCDTLGAFLRGKARRTFEWPLAKDRRHHIHARIDAAELPVRHETRRTGRPYTLVLTKRQDLFTRERQARDRDEADLTWLTQQWTPAR